MPGLQRALRSLDGLSVGDAFGERFFAEPTAIEQRRLPAAPWRWTDDTAMALGIVRTLAEHGKLDRDALAANFAAQYLAQPDRGYGRGAHAVLSSIARGSRWQDAAIQLFGGEGSRGNGAAMRVAPLGAFFADDLDRAASEAQNSAVVTHAHAEAIAGAMAVAVCAALMARTVDGASWLGARALLAAVTGYVPAGAVRSAISRTVALPDGYSSVQAASELGSGQRLLALDTVPFALWVAVHYQHNYEEALWATVEGGGDMDTTCAIVGGLVSLVADVPGDWLAAREPLPA
ncbi:MAG TPA: ADP-ribosylglycohydrolase family protein [Candidatus Limnocylindria bacterium]|nr:ADP-ribosylglycohydrolase family protein [Candidatus Limnocylindria bacterium]